MFDKIKLNVPLLRERVPNLTVAARAVGLRPATVSNLCTGKIPVGRAEVRTLVALSSLAGCTLDELIIREYTGGMIETGIKLIDLFAPIVRGGTVGFVARYGMGQLVVLAELIHRLKRMGFASVFWTLRQDDPDLVDIMNEAESICSTGEQVYEFVSRHHPEQDVFLAADRELVLSGELAALQERFQEESGSSLTIALIDTRGEAIDEDSPYGPLDSLLRFDMDLVARRLYPAIDPVTSTSILQENDQLEATHAKVQQQARKLLRRYRELRSIVNIRGLSGIAEKDVITYQRGERLEAFMTQPFYVAEPYTKKPAATLPLHVIIEDVQRILDGSADDASVEELMYIGSFTQKDA
ncbi:MAG: hypothetical protein K6T83_11915 [Alicyclobacillus sp.]|nr:hypothetical protein [Alicyclobacillus sp.]